MGPRGRVSHADLAAHGGAPFGGNGNVVRHQTRTQLESFRGTPPQRKWAAERSGHWTIVTDEHVPRGGHTLDVDRGRDSSGPAMAAVDTETGDRAWEMFDSAQIGIQDLYDYSVANPAVAGAGGIAELGVDTRDKEDSSVGFSPTDGTLNWRMPLPDSMRVQDVAVGGDTAVVATADHRGRKEAGGSTTGVLLARSLGSGAERWRGTTDALIRSVVVDETILALTDDDEIVALQ